ncbi:MAG: tyrosine-type recombinase/integrase [Magnetococcales bacterium]|nr:tyrosine-type recombinase/integrase [Magnetococcales bacterium]
MAKGKITKRTVDAIEVSDKDDYLWDNELRGFGVKVTPARKRIYLVQYRAGNRTRRVTIGPHGPLTPEQARKEAIQLLGLVAEGQDPAEMKHAAKQIPTVAELCDQYLREGVATKKPSTLATDRGRIERHIKPLLGNYRVDEVLKTDVTRFLQAVAEGKTSIDVKTGFRGRAIVTGGKGTATRTLGLLGAIFAFAVEHRYRTDNPTKSVKKFKHNKRERFLTADELSRLGGTLRRSAEDGGNLYGIAAIRLLLFTGCRRGEVLKLEWAHVDLEQGCLRLPDPKTGAKVVHLGEPAIQLLRNLPRADGQPYVFPGLVHGKPLVGLHRIWTKIRDEAQLPNLRIHDLRHGFASIGVMSGMGLPIVGALLGHKTPTVTDRYAHLADDPLKMAANSIATTIASALDGEK